MRPKIGTFPVGDVLYDVAGKIRHLDPQAAKHYTDLAHAINAVVKTFEHRREILSNAPYAPGNAPRSKPSSAHRKPTRKARKGHPKGHKAGCRCVVCAR